MNRRNPNEEGWSKRFPRFQIYQKKCQPGTGCPVKYPEQCVCQQCRFNSDGEMIPFGYQPKLHNPGGLKFYMYDYPFQTASNPPGKGWYAYQRTGKYDISTPLNMEN